MRNFNIPVKYTLIVKEWSINAGFGRQRDIDGKCYYYDVKEIVVSGDFEGKEISNNTINGEVQITTISKNEIEKLINDVNNIDIGNDPKRTSEMAFIGKISVDERYISAYIGISKDQLMTFLQMLSIPAQRVKVTIETYESSTKIRHVSSISYKIEKNSQCG